MVINLLIYKINLRMEKNNKSKELLLWTFITRETLFS